MPYAGTKGGQVDLFRMVAIRNHPVPPMKIVTFYPFPGFSIVIASVCTLAEGITIKPSLMAWIGRHIVYILIFIEDRSPGESTVLRKEYTTIAFQCFIGCHSAFEVSQVDIRPARQVKAVFIFRIIGKAVGVQNIYRTELAPGFCAIGRFINRTGEKFIRAVGVTVRNKVPLGRMVSSKAP